MKMTMIERLALIEGRVPVSPAADASLAPQQPFDLERVIWDEKYREEVMQILNDGYRE